MAWLLSHLPGVAAMDSKSFSGDGSQEVDMTFWNELQPDGFPEATTGTIFGECKNWQRRVDSSDIAWFDWKMRLGGVHCGVLFAANGITMDANRLNYSVQILTKAHQEGRTIYVLQLDEIEGLTSTGDLRTLLIRKKLGLTAQAPFN